MDVYTVTTAHVSGYYIIKFRTFLAFVGAFKKFYANTILFGKNTRAKLLLI